MFGISAYSQTPFASLAGNVIALSLTENINAADTNSQVWAFKQTITEDSTLNDINSGAGTFIGTIVETFSFADSKIGRAHV